MKNTLSSFNYSETGEVVGIEFANILCVLAELTHGRDFRFVLGCQECGSGVACRANDVVFFE